MIDPRTGIDAAASALDEAKDTLYRIRCRGSTLVRMLLDSNALRMCDVDRLRDLKRELQDFNATRGRWK